MMYYTYGHIRPDTGVIFNVGKGSKLRAYSKSKRNDHWHHVVNKNGGKFDVIIFNWFNNEDDALHAEIWQIAKLKPFGHLVNKTPGGEGVRGEIISGLNNPMHRPEQIARMKGDGNPMRNPETAKKAANSNRGKKRSPEFCEKYKGENNPMFGKETTEKQKKAVSDAQTGKPKSHTQRSKTSVKVSGSKNGMFGKTGSLNPMFGKISAMKGKTNFMAAFANYIRHVPYWGA